MDDTLAAQYLRVSTERQEYSLRCQIARIATYALEHNFTVCQSYVDEAKSGLEIKHRKGLSQLLRDVVGGKQPYRAILVYDVSRWGRFQDPDEAAAYEFLCKAAGVQVHYCAEPFQNDGYLPHVILKSLKRVMAGEYSRELSEKVFAAQIRAARDGFWVGAASGYGLRRMLISADRIPTRQLEAGEWKSVSNERIKLIPGPEAEVHWVQEIYRMYIIDKRSMQDIADELNRLRVPNAQGRRWNAPGIRQIIINPKYMGTFVFNRRSYKLNSPRKNNPEAQWIIIPNAYPAIIDPPTFEAAQEIVRSRTRTLSNEQLLAGLRSILQAKGRLSGPLLRDMPNTAGKNVYTSRFGSLTRAFELAGYDSAEKLTILHRMQFQNVRTELMNCIVREFRGEVSIQTRGLYPRRNCLRLKNGTRVAVRTCSCRVNKYKGPTWVLPEVCWREDRMVTLLVALNVGNTSAEFLYVVPPIANRREVRLSRNHSWFNEGIRLNRLSSFCDSVRRILDQGKRPLGRGRTEKGWLSDEALAAVREATRRRWDVINKARSREKNGRSDIQLSTAQRSRIPQQT